MTGLKEAAQDEPPERVAAVVGTDGTTRVEEIRAAMHEEETGMSETEHYPGCNDLCGDGGHFLLGDGARLEYGVIVDRTESGLGFFLASTHASREHADRSVARANLGGYPAQIKVRCVQYGAWTALPTTHTDDRAEVRETLKGASNG